MTVRIALNCDLGEGYGRWELTPDEALLPHIDAANIACGVHAGDPTRMRTVTEKAVALGVGIGAHPSYPDRHGFGRRPMTMDPVELRDLITYQIGALQAFARAAGGRVEHVKAHGALYNAAATDPQVAAAVVDGAMRADPQLIVVALAGSVLERTARDKGARVAREAFADRAYDAQGRLLSRSEPGAVLTDVRAIADQVRHIVREGRVRAISGQWVPVAADTVCLHGDTPGAAQLVAQVRELLRQDGIAFGPIGLVVAERKGPSPAKRAQ